MYKVSPPHKSITTTTPSTISSYYHIMAYIPYAVRYIEA